MWPPLPDAAAHEAEWLARFDASIPRNTVRDTWNWAWKDTAGRVLPFFAGAGLYAWLSGRGPEGIGITAEGWRREALLGIAVGVPLAGLAAAFRGWVAPGYRLPTDADQLTQTLFYFAINAPGEELFWRGTVQNLAVRGLARVPRIGKLAGLLGWAAATAVFGAYHRLGKLELALDCGRHLRRGDLRRALPVAARQTRQAFDPRGDDCPRLRHGGIPQLGRLLTLSAPAAAFPGNIARRKDHERRLTLATFASGG